ncbi:MAG: alkaline phosphatase D family protein [Betaproteobacteria bacterium]
MAIKLGPVLSFRGVLEQRWHVSALLAQDNATPPELRWQAGDADGEATTTLLAAFPEAAPDTWVWRCDFGIALGATAQTVGYRLGAEEWQFAVPAAGDIPNMAYASCNGFSSLKLMNDTKAPYALWRDLGQKHAERPYHLLLMGGDQLYADSLFDTLPALHGWLALSREEKVKRPFTAAMARAVQRFFREVYLKRWSQPDTSAVFARIPTVMMWDDHDIFDGWGSYPPDLQASPVYQGIFASACEAFRLYQLQLAAGETHPAAIAGQTAYNLGFQFGPLAILAVDMRSERSDSQVVSPTSWKAVYDWLDAVNDQCAHLLLMSSIPVVHPDFSMLEKALSIFPGQQELEDDLRDHWRSNPHKQERLRLIHRLLDFARTHQCRVTLLSGDVHVGAVGVVKSLRDGSDDSSQTLTQLTSSGIVHPPPPGMVLFFLEHVVGKEMSDDRDISSVMTEFPGTRSYYIGARNWLALEPDAQRRLWANWHVEGAPYPFTKVIHPVDFEMPEAAVGKMDRTC